MIAIPVPLTAAQRTRAAFEEMQQRQRDAALERTRRERTRNVRLALASTVIILIGLVASLFYGLPVWLHSGPTAKAKPVEPFVASRVGHIRVPYKGDICRQVGFDNRTGIFRTESLVVCDGVKQARGGTSNTQTRSRLNSLSNAFKH